MAVSIKNTERISASIQNQDRNRFNAHIRRFLIPPQFKGNESDMQLQNYSSLASQDKGIKLGACHVAASMKNPDRDGSLPQPEHFSATSASCTTNDVQTQLFHSALHTSAGLHNLFTCGPTRMPALPAAAASHTATDCGVSTRAVSFLPSCRDRLLCTYPCNSHCLLNQSNRHCKRQRFLNLYSLGHRHHPTPTHASFLGHHLLRTMNRKTYSGGNKANYVQQHLKRLEAEGRCYKCAEKIGSQGEEAHKKSCKATGAKCKYCVSQNMGSRAKGHLEAACAKKLHAQARNINADGDDESASGHLSAACAKLQIARQGAAQRSLFQRRVELLKMGQQRGESFNSFVVRFNEAWDDTDMDEVLLAEAIPTPVCCRRERVKTYKAIASLLFEQWEIAYLETDMFTPSPSPGPTPMTGTPPASPSADSPPTTPWMTPSSS